MPALEAPKNFDDESSSDTSIPADLGVDTVPVPAIAQIRIQTQGTQHMPTERQVETITNDERLRTQQTLPQTRTAAAITTPGTDAANEATARPISVENAPLPALADNIFAELEAEANLTLNWPNSGPAAPPVVNLLPVTLPPQAAEPQLDELLRRVSQRNDLHNVEEVRLRVISAITVSLSRLAMFMPRLQRLDLSGSVLYSLRDLGCGLIHLSYLNVSNCGLNSFDGISGMPSVRTVVADGNMIQRVGPLTQLPLLQYLSAKNNRINDLGLLTFLAMCSNLSEIELQGNPVCHLPLYRRTLQRNIGTLRCIDGIAIGELEDAASTVISADERQQQQLQSTISSRTNFSYRPIRSIPSSSSSSFSCSSSNSSSLQTAACDDEALASFSSDLNVRQLHRPATAPTSNEQAQQLAVVKSLTSNRPASASTLQNSQQTALSTVTASSLVVAGSVLDLVRSNRRRSHRHAWLATESFGNSTTSSSSTASHGSLEPVLEVEPPTKL